MRVLNSKHLRLQNVSAQRPNHNIAALIFWYYAGRFLNFGNHSTVTALRRGDLDDRKCECGWGLNPSEAYGREDRFGEGFQQLTRVLHARYLRRPEHGMNQRKRHRRLAKTIAHSGACKNQ